MKSPLILLITLALLLSGGASCAFKEGSSELSNVAALVFIGDAGGAELQIDEEPPIKMSGSGEGVRYQIAPGARRVRVWRAGAVIVDRTVFVSPGQSFEVLLP